MAQLLGRTEQTTACYEVSRNSRHLVIVVVNSTLIIMVLTINNMRRHFTIVNSLAVCS